MERKLIIFDLDGTLTPSKSDIQENMAVLLCELLDITKVAVMGGGSLRQFQRQFIAHVHCNPDKMKNLFILPISGAGFYIYKNGGWERLYEHQLAPAEKEKVNDALARVMEDIRYQPPRVTYGDVIEDRGSQITFSANGQQAPLEVKSKWDPDRKKRLRMVERLKIYLPEFDVKIGGTNSIDITKHGINKAYGVRRIADYLKLHIADAVYIGDALYEDGNDAIVKETGIDTVQVTGPGETERFISAILEKRAQHYAKGN